MDNLIPILYTKKMDQGGNWTIHKINEKSKERDNNEYVVPLFQMLLYLRGEVGFHPEMSNRAKSSEETIQDILDEWRKQSKNLEVAVSCIIRKTEKLDGTLFDIAHSLPLTSTPYKNDIEVKRTDEGLNFNVTIKDGADLLRTFQEMTGHVINRKKPKAHVRNMQGLLDYRNDLAREQSELNGDHNLAIAKLMPLHFFIVNNSDLFKVEAEELQKTRKLLRRYCTLSYTTKKISWKINYQGKAAGLTDAQIEKEVNCIINSESTGIQLITNPKEKEIMARKKKVVAKEEVADTTAVEETKEVQAETKEAAEVIDGIQAVKLTVHRNVNSQKIDG